jgi:hypothetical protein
LLKNSCFVSGHDFSRAESTLFAVGFSPWLSLHSLQSDFFSTLFSPASSKPRSGLPLCRRPERSQEGEATDLIAFAVACFLFFPFLAQKSHNLLEQNKIELAF